jgi:hypothetical protein
MDSSRITKIEGKFMGVSFTVKPTPLNVNQVEEEQREMLLSWYKEHYPETHKKLEDNVDFEQYKADDIKALNAWRQDVEFRAKYLKQMAEHCMEFSKSLPKDTWERDDLAYSTIKEAWDFFCEKRLVP